MLLRGILTKGDTEISLLSDVYCGNSIHLQTTQQSKRSVVNKPR